LRERVPHLLARHLAAPLLRVPHRRQPERPIGRRELVAVLGFGAEPSPVVDVRAVEPEHDRRAIWHLTRATAGLPPVDVHPHARAGGHAVTEKSLRLRQLATLNQLSRLSLD